MRPRFSSQIFFDQNSSTAKNVFIGPSLKNVGLRSCDQLIKIPSLQTFVAILTFFVLRNILQSLLAMKRTSTVYSWQFKPTSSINMQLLIVFIPTWWVNQKKETAERLWMHYPPAGQYVWQHLEPKTSLSAALSSL